jgi:hypothetical protein
MPLLQIVDSVVNILPVFRRHADGKFKCAGLIRLTPDGRRNAAVSEIVGAGSEWINKGSLYQLPYL